MRQDATDRLVDGDGFRIQALDVREDGRAGLRDAQRMLVQRAPPRVAGVAPPRPGSRNRERRTAMVSCTRETYAVGTR